MLVKFTVRYTDASLTAQSDVPSSLKLGDMYQVENVWEDGMITIQGHLGKFHQSHFEVIDADFGEGEKVRYETKWDEPENGIVKSSVGDYCFVVFKCGGNWDKFMYYTGKRTAKSELKHGWIQKPKTPSPSEELGDDRPGSDRYHR